MSASDARRALVSVSDKTGLDSFVQSLVALGWEIISTGGTRRFLLEQGIPVQDISEYTGFPEMMEGRLKTLHPRVHGGLLGRPDLPEDAHAMQTHGILPFGMVVCNLYPFEATVARPDVTIELAIENIDIGGPSMVRSSAKNHAYVGVVTSPEQYAEVLAALQGGNWTPAFRRKLAARAFALTAAYDRAIADYMANITVDASPATSSEKADLSERLTVQLNRHSSLRYGENPHQQAAFYLEGTPRSGTLASATQRHGKELSYNNLLDLDAALNLVREFSDPAAVVIKHTNPCGAAMGATPAEAFLRAYAGDPVSAFGSILGFNREVDLAIAEELCQPDRFVEAIIAPGYSPEAFTALTTRPKWKANVRLMECPGLASPRNTGWEYRCVTGGMLVQTRDDAADPEADWKVVTARVPTATEWRDLKFAWGVVRHVKSNAIVFVQNGMVVGVGAGQMSRVDSAMIAAHKAGQRAAGGVVASDAFFPFRDGVDQAAAAGIRAVIQPGGSRNDPEVIAACNEHGLAMVLTGRRHFKH